MDFNNTLFSKTLNNKLKNAKSICILTGAGISAESGVPTFRDADGLWAKFKPEELANLDAFLNNPELVWSWYQHRRDIINHVKPNAGHFAVVEIEKNCPRFHLITQNVDGLHGRAGSKNILELHGNIMRSLCIQCGEFDQTAETSNITPRSHCETCNGRMRPDVVWFGEMLPPKIIQKATVESEACDLFFSVGTSSVVYPAAGLPILAKENGAYVVEVNAQKTEISHLCDESLLGLAGKILPQLVNVLLRR